MYDMRDIVLEQVDHQYKMARARIAIIRWVFVAGLLVSVLGLAPTLYWFRETGSPTGKAVFFGLFTLLFGSGVFQDLTWKYWLTPRIVPCFAREIEPYGGRSSAAFWRGRALYLELAALDQLAQTLGVRQLSEFGFKDDFYGQQVQWHKAAEGLRTAQALKQGLDARLQALPEVVHDLDALLTVLSIANQQNIDFCLMLRLQKSDWLQGVMTREERQGKFW